MKDRIEVLIPLIALAYIAFFPLYSGEISRYFIKSYILLPFILVFIALTVLSFGLLQLIELAKSLKSLVSHGPVDSNLNKLTLNGAISYAYVASMLWSLYMLVVSTAHAINTQSLISDIALAFTYAFLLAELILSRLKKRLAFLQLAK